jgi:DNA-binding protein YbaB
VPGAASAREEENHDSEQECSMSGYEAHIDELLAQYRAQRDKAVETRKQISEASGTAASPRQSVKATVNVHGELVSLEFPTGAYKQMPPTELAETILATVRDAKAKALDALRELSLPPLPGGHSIADLLEGKINGPLLPDEPPMPDAVRDFIATGRIPSRIREQ